MRNDIREMVLETMVGFYKTGTVGEITLKEVNAIFKYQYIDDSKMRKRRQKAIRPSLKTVAPG